MRSTPRNSPAGKASTSEDSRASEILDRVREGLVLLDDAVDRYDAMFTAAEARRGQELYAQLGCAACHQMGTAGGYVGPELSHTGERLTPGWIAAWLTSPTTYKPGTLQPDYGLSRTDARALTAYLSSLGTGERSPRAGGRP